MKKLFNKLFIVALGSVMLASCVEDVESQYLTEEQDEAAMEALPGLFAAKVSGMHSGIGAQNLMFNIKIFSSARDDDFGYPAVTLSQDLNGPDMVSDNSGYNWFSVSSEYADRSDTYANPVMRYGVLYNQIKAANDVLKSAADLDPEGTDPQMQVYKGQAKAVRAFDYLSLAPYFQYKYKGNEDKPCVPIITEETTNFSNNERASLQKVYKLIIDDLTEAITLLDGYKRTTKGQIDQQVAYGLRARAYLYMEEWANAAADAEKALAGYTPYSRQEVSQPTFISANDHNWMWGLIITPANISGPYPTWPAKMSSFSGDGYASGAGCYKSINSLLFDLIPETDVRKGWWVDSDLHSANLANLVWEFDGKRYAGDEIASSEFVIKMKYLPYTNVKFAQYGGLGSTTNAGDWCLMRAEEMILIRAEALAMSGDEPTGKQVLESFVKTYRDPSYTIPTNRSFQDEVWFQRRVELWGEGFSMADIMRLGKNVVRTRPGKSSNFPEAFQFNIASNDGWLLLRFPQRETNNNRAIVQNNEGTQPLAGQNPDLTDGVTD